MSLAAMLGVGFAAYQSQAIKPSTAPAPVPDTSDADAVFVTQIQGRAQAIGNMDPEVLAELGWAMCEAIGQSREPVVRPYPLDGISPYDTFVITDSATAYLCPENRSKVREYLHKKPTRAQRGIRSA